VMVHQPPDPFVSPRGVVEYVRRVADAAGLPVVLYLRNAAIGEAAIAGLTAIPGVVAVKWASTDLMALARAVRAAPDMRGIAEGFLGRWFPTAMLQAGGPVIEHFRAMLLATERQGLAGALAAVRDADLRRSARLIEAPTLVIAGADDTVTSARHGAELAAAIPGARLLTLPSVHLPNVELPQAYLDAVLHFLH